MIRKIEKIKPTLGEIIRFSWWTSDVIHNFSKRLQFVRNFGVLNKN